MADCLNNEQQINSNLSESNVDSLTSNLDGASSVTSEMSNESSISSTMYSAETTASNLGSEEPLNSELDLPTTYTYKGSETDNITVTVDNKGFIISASVKQIKFKSFDDFPEVGSEHLIYIDATNKALYGWDANSGYYKLVADVKVPTKLSEFTNDGDGTNPFITKVVSDLQNYYTKSETYTQDEIKNLVSAIPKFSIKVVTELPTTDISETTVYLVASGSGEQNLYVEYIYINDTWEKLGEQTIDLSGYVKTETFNKLANNTTQIIGSNNDFKAGGAISTGNYSVAIGKDSKSSTAGTAVGHNAVSTGTGAAIGLNTKSHGGGAVGGGASTVSGGAVGSYAFSGVGFSGGSFAKTMNVEGTAIDAIQLGTGTNNTSKSLQVYDDNIYNAETHTLTVKNIELDGEDIKDKIGSGGTKINWRKWTNGSL